jgi:D-glycero-D-manno-heptose 1,7-bisphosphate phosphatase
VKRKALFLDRDGVINIDYGYVHEPENCVFIDGIFELVRRANAAHYVVAVVTNQAGIGRGYFTEAQFAGFTGWMRDAFASRGATIDRVFYCPHHPQDGLADYRRECACRKPQPGMLLQAQREFDLDMAASIIVGDKLSDLKAGASAGVGSCFLFAPDEAASGEGDVVRISNLLDILPLIQPAVSARRSPTTQRSA